MSWRAVTHVCVVVLVLVVAILILVQTQRTRQMVVKSSSISELPSSVAPYVLVGMGLTAAAFLQSLTPSLRFAFTGREASAGIGGRALSLPPPATPISSNTGPHEFAAWIYQPILHPDTASFVSALGVPSAEVDLVLPTSFIYDAATDTRLPWGVLPFISDPLVAYGSVRDPAQALLWYAHCGFWPSDVPGAAIGTMSAQDAPRFALVPCGFGWQDVIARGLGTTPILYGYQLVEVRVPPGATPNDILTFRYASGDVEELQGAVLTMPPLALANIKGVPGDLASAIRAAFVTASGVIMYATWNASDVWWPGAGWPSGIIATNLAIGRVTVVGPATLRFAASGPAHTSFWNDLYLTQGPDAVAAAMATQLQTVFKGSTLKAPANVAVRAWPNATSFWAAGVSLSQRDLLMAALAQPWGPEVGVFWANADASAFSGWVEGAVQAGRAIADTALAFHDRVQGE